MAHRLVFIMKGNSLDSLTFFRCAGCAWMVPKLRRSIGTHPLPGGQSLSRATDLWPSPATSCTRWRSGLVRGSCSCWGYARWMCVQKGEWGMVALALTVYCPVCILCAYCPLVYSQRPWPGSAWFLPWSLKSHWGDRGRGLEIENPALDCDFATGSIDRKRAFCSGQENKHIDKCIILLHRLHAI